MALSVTVHGITVKTGTQTAGRQATANIAVQDGVENVIYTVPSTPGFDYAILAISVCNRLPDQADKISIAIADSDLSKPWDWIEWNTSLVPHGVLERTQIVAQRGQRIIVRWGDALTELVPDFDDPTAPSWSYGATGTGTWDIGTTGQASYTLAEGDTAYLNSSNIALTDGSTYRVAVSFYSTDVTGVASSIVLQGRDVSGPSWVPLITLGIEDRNQTDVYKTYTQDFTVDDALGTYTTNIQYLQIAFADVNATVDRISLVELP